MQVNAGQGFKGLWDAFCGMMRLNLDGQKITGAYSSDDNSSILGTQKRNRVDFRYKEGNGTEGEGVFVLSEDGKSFTGKWRQDASQKWKAWNGPRVAPQAGKSCLIVLEANWVTSLNEKDYSFGDVLKVYFNRFKNVEVRHRYFTGVKSLEKWLWQSQFIAEPVYLSISTHGTKKGVSVNSEVIDQEVFIKEIKSAPNIKLLHFAACLIMEGEVPQKILASKPIARFPISGYTTSVDWTQSAVLEILYFSLIFENKMSPVKAVEQVKKNFPSGNSKVKGSVFQNAGFKILSPLVKE